MRRADPRDAGSHCPRQAPGVGWDLRTRRRLAPGWGCGAAGRAPRRAQHLCFLVGKMGIAAPLLAGSREAA